tara:strand:- start:2477 stop:4168 length:1692 start_codon:yes stop_codon:yes gene_type:complete
MYKINHIKSTVINILSIIFHVIIGAIFIVNLGLASVMATIDRSQVELNETFTLKVIVDTAIDEEPDASALEKDFFVGSRSQLSNTTIINGQISRSRTWTYALMAKRSGKLVIPPVIIAKERSLPIDILITPQSEAILGEADIFISAELDMDENYVQAQTLLKIKIYRMVQTRQPRLFEPEISGVETLIEIAGDDKNYESVINGKTYDVIERIYALFPQVSGELLIEPIRFEARILKNGSITGRRTYQSSKSIIKVLPIPAPPKDYPNAKWLPAREVKINDEWSRDLQNLKTGEPITRQIKVNAVGQLSTQLPPIDYKLDANLKIYPDKPKLSDNIRAEGIIASRIDQYAMIGISAGKIELPSVNLPWWDIDEKIWKIASLSMQNISIKPSIEVLKEKESVPIIEESELTPNKSNITSDVWRNISGILGTLWLLTILLWFYSKPKKNLNEQKIIKPGYKKREKYLRKVVYAAQKNQKEKFKKALFEWANIQWPNNKPRSIEEIALRVKKPLSDELLSFNKVAYGPKQKYSWDGKIMVESIKNISLNIETDKQQSYRSLPELAPE